MAETLLQKAKGSTFQARITDEEIELALAWLHGEVTLLQVKAAGIKRGKGSYVYGYGFLATRLRDAAKKGILIKSADAQMRTRISRLQAVEARAIDDVGLSVRSYNALMNMGIRTIGDLVVMSESQLKTRPNFGSKSLSEVKKKLALMGLGLGLELEIKQPEVA